ncbi:MAG: hypothetical protein CSB47_05220 [Proteobacteria bacterium]|nr:MAG: hypothetical protein CSB47_05220 [Pseudomonadota bacterium]
MWPWSRRLTKPPVPCGPYWPMAGIIKANGCTHRRDGSFILLTNQRKFAKKLLRCMNVSDDKQVGPCFAKPE